MLGTGAYGIALASQLVKNNHEIVMWTENQDKYIYFKENHNLNNIIKYDMPSNITVSNNLKETINSASIIFFTCASKYVSKMAMDIKGFYHKNTPICIASKGIEENTGRLLSSIVKDTLKTSNIAVISGPTFAIDMVNNNPVALAIAAYNKYTKQVIINALSSDTLKLRSSKDIIGIQICGSIKNIIAIASGILGGLGYSESSQAFLINESLHDIKDLLFFLGGKPKTILSYAGVGDLLMTSMSKKSRNYSFGLVCALGDTIKINDFLQKNTVEGYNTLKTIINLLNKRHLSMPLIYLIKDIIDGKTNPDELVNFLINKE